jgi:hypothetical protein
MILQPAGALFDFLTCCLLVSSLKAYHDSSVYRSTSLRGDHPLAVKSVDKWEEAMSAAITSQEFRDAETKRQTQLTEEANSTVEEAMAYLKRRYGIPTFNGIISNRLSSNVAWMQFRSFTNRSLIMSGWNDEEIEKVRVFLHVIFS